MSFESTIELRIAPKYFDLVFRISRTAELRCVEKSSGAHLFCKQNERKWKFQGEIQIKLVKIKIQIKGFVRFLKRLLDNAKQGLLVEGQVRSVHQWIDMSKQEVYLEDGKLILRDYF